MDQIILLETTGLRMAITLGPPKPLHTRVNDSVEAQKKAHVTFCSIFFFLPGPSQRDTHYSLPPLHEYNSTTQYKHIHATLHRATRLKK